MQASDLHFGAGLSGGMQETAAQARRLEDLGFEHVTTGEHVMRGNPPQPTGMTLPVLAVAAGATSRVRLVPSILLAPLYHPVMLAKLTTTLDVASGGRLTLGVGGGGEYPVEFEALGVPVQERGARMNACLRQLKRLWTEEHVSDGGRFYPLNDVTLLPRPLQQPHPPIWVAGRREAAMRRAARYGDGWLPYFYSPERYRESVERITAIAAETGRDLSGFQWAHYAFISIYDTPEEAAAVAAARLGGRYSSRADMLSIIGQYAVLGSVADCIRRLERYIEAGARYFTFVWSCKPEDVDRHIETVAKEIVPHFRS